jgi:hypothetical protein
MLGEIPVMVAAEVAVERVEVVEVVQEAVEEEVEVEVARVVEAKDAAAVAVAIFQRCSRWHRNHFLN